MASPQASSTRGRPARARRVATPGPLAVAGQTLPALACGVTDSDEERGGKCLSRLAPPSVAWPLELMIPGDETTALQFAPSGGRLTSEQALALAEDGSGPLQELLRAASARRDAVWGPRLSYSRKVFLPLTNLCRDRCSYCTFRRSPGDPGEWTMRPEEIEDWVARARAQGCKEALFCLGDRPDVFASYRALMAQLGHQGTVDYLRFACERALAAGLLPHTNAGVLTRDEMACLKEVNVSLGLMLENVSERLCAAGMPHHRAPDKRPARRLKMIHEAGELRIPFTTGILIGIGETRRERIESLLALRELHERHGHIQEVIVQPFRRKETIPMAEAPEPDPEDLLWTVAVARLVMGPEVSVQSPPNLHPEGLENLLAAGLNDFGGISPVSADYVNPEAPWPHIERLAERCARRGFTLGERLAIYPAYVERPGFLSEQLRPATQALLEQLRPMTPEAVTR